LTANHRQQILGTTTGHPGSWSDKTLVLYDDFIRDIKSGAILDDYTFELLERQGDTVVAVTYQGVWIVVDNGYQNWSITVPPFSNSCRYDEIRWSEWIESMRKDVEVSEFWCHAEKEVSFYSQVLFFKPSALSEFYKAGGGF
jgi:hypothetical protein